MTRSLDQRPCLTAVECVTEMALHVSPNDSLTKGHRFLLKVNPAKAIWLYSENCLNEASSICFLTNLVIISSSEEQQGVKRTAVCFLHLCERYDSIAACMCNV